MDKIKLSIIIPTYNRAQLLCRCIQSVLSSRKTDIELIVSDNASFDKTQDVLGSFKDERLIYWRNDTNIGLEKNIIKLFHAARGEWILCLTDDDYLLPDALDRLMHVIAFTNAGMIRTALKIIDQKENENEEYEFHRETTIFQPGMDSLSNLFWTAHIFSGLAIRREWLDLGGIGKHSNSMYPQMYFVGALLKHHPGFYLNENLVAHTINNKTFWVYTSDFMVKTRLEMIKKMLPGKKWKRERQVLTNQTIKEIYLHLWLSVQESPLQWVRHQIALLQIIEVIFSPFYWFSLLRFIGIVGQKICFKLINMIRKIVSKGPVTQILL